MQLYRICKKSTLFVVVVQADNHKHVWTVLENSACMCLCECAHVHTDLAFCALLTEKMYLSYMNTP